MDEPDQSPGEYNGPSYRSPDSIVQSELRNALAGLAMFGSDPNLRNQAFNLALIDEFVTGLEWGLLKKQFKEDSVPLPEMAFLSALSQMWIFAAYELMRTWRQRAKEIVEWSAKGTLQTRLDELERDVGYEHLGRQLRAAQLKAVLANPSSIAAIQDALRRTHIPFVRLEAIRVSIAKHEIRRQKNSVALMPTHGRINRWCGSLDFELENGVASIGYISRRDIADDIRSFPSPSELPTDEQIRDFETFMRGPPDDADWG